MTTAVGSPVQFFSDAADGYDGAVLPGLLAANGPGPGDDGATIVAFGRDGKTLVRTGVFTRTTWLALGGSNGPSWGAVA